MTNGASVWPKNILAVAESDSDPDVFMVFDMMRAVKETTLCMMP